MANLVKLTIGYDQLIKEKTCDNYAWHKKSWDMFKYHPELKDRGLKPYEKRGPCPFLSRYTQKFNHDELLIISKYKPKRPDWCRKEQWQLTQINSSYLSQPSYLFDLYANPTKSVKKENGKGGYTKNGKRLSLMDIPAQTKWLTAKGQLHGFKLAEHVPLRIDKPVFHRFNRKGKKGLHVGVRFQGGLFVTDPSAFQKAFLEGIGTAKGFGFGLLLVKPTYL